MDIRSIQRALPHRYPMLLVDRVLELVGDQKAIGIKNVSINEPFFQGHYPMCPSCLAFLSLKPWLSWADCWSPTPWTTREDAGLVEFGWRQDSEAGDPR